MPRYKKILFDDFKKGRGQKFYEIAEKAKYRSDDSVNFDEDGQVIPAPSFIYTSFELGTDANSNFKYQHSDTLENYIFFAGWASGDELKLYRASIGGSFSLKQTITGTENVLRGFTAFNRFFMHYYDGSDYLLKYTNSDGASVTNTDYAETEAINSHAYDGETLYLAVDNGKILKATEKSSFSEFIDLSEKGIFANKIFIIGGFLYGFIGTSDKPQTLVKFYADGSYTELRTFYVDSESIDYAIIDSNRAIIGTLKNTSLSFFELDIRENSINKIFETKNSLYVSFKLHTFKTGNVFLSIEERDGEGYTYHSYIIDTEYSYFHFHEFATDFEIQHVIPVESDPYFQAVGANITARMYRVDFDSVGGTSFLYLPIIRLHGAIPKQLTMRHAPLPKATAEDVAEFNIYVKEDRGSWSASVLESKTENAVKKTYTFPKGKKPDFIEFAIGITPNSDDEIPEDPELEFLYIEKTQLNSSE
jgi:hypothetical protein